jgi:outer membrane protein
MQTKKIVFLTTGLLLLCVGLSYGADVAKIGVFDFGKILETSSAGKAAQAELNKTGAKMGEDLKKKGADLEELQKRLEREALVMSQEKRMEKEREFRIKVNDFKTLQQQYSKTARQMQEKLTKEIGREIQALVSAMGKKEGYLLILEKGKGGVWYYPNPIDVTDKLIQQYNVQFAKKLQEQKNIPKQD